MGDIRVYQCPCCAANLDNRKGYSKLVCNYCGSVVQISANLPGEEYAMIMDALIPPLTQRNNLWLHLSYSKERLANLENERIKLSSKKNKRKPKVRAIVILVITALLVLGLGCCFWAASKSYYTPPTTIAITFLSVGVVGSIFALINYFSIKKKIQYIVSDNWRKIGEEKNKIETQTKTLEKYDNTLNEYDSYVKMLRRTDKESLEYIKYVLYVEEATTIPAACKLNEKRIKDEHKLQEEMKKQLLREQAEQNYLQNEKRKLENERRRLEVERERQQAMAYQQSASRQSSDSGSIDAKKVIIGGAVVAGAIALGPLAWGIAAKTIRRML